MKKITRIFSLEGIDGSGKTTQLKEISSVLRQKGFKVLTLKSPSDTIFGNFIRSNVKIINQELLKSLFILDIKDQQRGSFGYDVVIWDRFVDSFYASDVNMGDNEFNKIIKIVGSPEKTFFLDLEPSVVIQDRQEVIDHHVIESWQQSKKNRYKLLHKKFSDRIIRIDAVNSVSKITDQIISEIILKV